MNLSTVTLKDLHIIKSIAKLAITTSGIASDTEKQKIIVPLIDYFSPA